MLRVSPQGLTRLLLCATPPPLVARRHAHAHAAARELPPHLTGRRIPDTPVAPQTPKPALSEYVGKETLSSRERLLARTDGRHVANKGEPGASRLHWHGRFRALAQAKRHEHKGRDAQVAPLHGTRISRQHLHARKHLRSLVSQEVSDENGNTPVDHSALDVTGMIHHLERLPADMIPHTYKAHGLRMTLLSLLAVTHSPTMAWDAYHLLTLLPHRDGVPIEHLHRLSRLLAQQQPRTRRVFLRILSVLRAIYAAGGVVKKWQWNLLLDAAGKGTRKVHLEDFRTALDVLDDMRTGRAPGATFLSAGRAERGGNRTFSPDDRDDSEHTEDAQTHFMARDTEYSHDADPEREPDIYTHTALLAHAALTRDSRALRRVSTLHASTPHKKVTHIILLSLFTQRHDWAAVRGALRKIGPLKQKGFGAVIWAFASAGRIDVAERMYDVSRTRGKERERLRQELVDTDEVQVVNQVRPDAAVYHALIQAYAYHGDLARCLRMFQDMLIAGASKSNTASGSQPMANARDAIHSLEPTMAAYRAIFLGFYRHGTTSTSPDAVWTIHRLLPVFHRFLDLPENAKPKRTLIFWILSALWRTSDRDADIVFDAVKKLQARFGGEGRWTGRLERLRAMVEDVARAGEKVGDWEEEDSSTHQ